MNRTPIRRQRSGFTLIEILVVVGLILFLMSISVVTLANAIGVARQRATETTILKIHGLLQQRVEAFDRAMQRTNLSQNSPPIRNMENKWLNAYQIVPPPKVLEIMVRKQFFMWRFPQNFAEFPDGDSKGVPTGDPPGAIAKVSSGKTFDGSNFDKYKHKPETESAEILYWILTNSEVYGVSPVDESEFTTSEVQDSDGDGLKEFVDAWGRPLRFYRWPTHLFRPGNGSTVGPGVIDSGGGVAALAPIVDRTIAVGFWSGLPALPTTGELDPLARDPDDPTGQIWRWAQPMGPTGPIKGIQNYFGTPNTYHAFLVMSAGPDGELGIQEPASPVDISLSSPAIGVGQGRLAALASFATMDANPINDNISNRKR